jgi:hypothetical protein
VKVWIIVESMFGNTREVADRIASGIRVAAPQAQFVFWNASAAPAAIPEDVSLLVVGAPTHAFGLPRRATREEAVKRGSTAQTSRGVREWLDEVGLATPRLPAACFDTRVDRRFVPGSAAWVVARRLRRLGCRLVSDPMTFYVEDTAGPLRPEETDRAVRLGKMIGEHQSRVQRAA